MVVSIPLTIIIYAVTLNFSMKFFIWAFENPQEWIVVIPILSGVVATLIAKILAKAKFESNMSGTIAILLIALFWGVICVVDFVSEDSVLAIDISPFSSFTCTLAWSITALLASFYHK